MKNLIVVLLVSVLNFSCENILPTPPQFCCKINKKQWIPEIKGALGSRNTGNATLYKKTGTFIIYGNSEDFFVSLGIKFDPKNGLELNKKYLINETLKLDSASSSLTVKNDGNSSISTDIKGINGYVIISKMDIQYFTGTFEYNLGGKVNGKSYRVTKGQFNNMLYGEQEN